MRTRLKSRVYALPAHVAIGLILAGLVGGSAEAQVSLNGSARSLSLQNQVARQHDFTYLTTASRVNRFVALGYLVRVPEGSNYVLHNISFPVARPEVKLFIERLSRQYRAACGELLYVTSLTRPKSHQPRNASSKSVHPTGMALDLRRPNNSRCRTWLESVLMQLEGSGVLEATRERRPPHYHVALFPSQYASYVARLEARAENRTYRVAVGDTLWDIARKYGVSVSSLRQRNNLSGSTIRPGQLLQISSW
ncbi:MAG: LysM peptidoglycan-binding domain-containing protein [Gemmatimonadetes bacterium]|nr:LysM peptidoglycan-binding domain-containing protein [Gemmatimonadota bacterium]